MLCHMYMYNAACRVQASITSPLEQSSRDTEKEGSGARYESDRKSDVSLCARQHTEVTSRSYVEESNEDRRSQRRIQTLSSISLLTRYLLTPLTEQLRMNSGFRSTKVIRWKAEGTTYSPYRPTRN